MICPVCKNVSLSDSVLEYGLNGYHCAECNGNWVRYNDYRDWMEKKAFYNTPILASMDLKPESDSKKACLCPDCGRILIKYRASIDLPFSIDHCSSCGGVWLDNMEWESLIKSNLHDQLYKVFTEPWQQKLKKDVSKKHIEEKYVKKFGNEDYLKLIEIREWIHKSNHKEEMLAFLLDEDPYIL